MASLANPKPCPDWSPPALPSSPAALASLTRYFLFPRPCSERAKAQQTPLRVGAPPQSLGLPSREGWTRALDPQGGKLRCGTVGYGGEGRAGKEIKSRRQKHKD